MIKDIPGFASANSLDELPDGEYTGIESRYQSTSNGLAATMMEIRRSADQQRMACDLLIVLADGSVLFRDFQRLSTGMWRDSNGLVDETLENLLPRELADAVLVSGPVQQALSISAGTIRWFSSNAV